MTHRYITQSGQGLRFDIMDSQNNRICIAHEEGARRHGAEAMRSEMIEKYLRQFMSQQTGLSVTPLLDAGLVYAEGPNNTWALTERGVEMLNGVGVNPAEDVVNHPAHYTKGGIECIDAIRAALTPEEFRGYCKGNAIKYSWRERHKGGNEDLKKASWYLTKISEE